VGHARDARQQPPDAFVREIALEGELDPAQRQRLVEIADRCPVHRSLEHGARISTREVGEIRDLAGVERAGQHAQDLDDDIEGT
jgi:putative redox protein